MPLRRSMHLWLQSFRQRGSHNKTIAHKEDFSMTFRPLPPRLPPRAGTWRPLPPRLPPRAGTWGRRREAGVIGHETRGKFRCFEFTIYYTYISEDVPSQEREFEFRIRVPVKGMQRPKSFQKLVDSIAEDKMISLGIDVTGKHWTKRSVGIRQVGMTDSKNGRYIVINKRSKWSWPRKGGWGVIRW